MIKIGTRVRMLVDHPPYYNNGDIGHIIDVGDKGHMVEIDFNDIAGQAVCVDGKWYTRRIDFEVLP